MKKEGKKGWPVGSALFSNLKIWVSCQELTLKIRKVCERPCHRTTQRWKGF